jgi:hypothetical protein
VGRGDRDQQGHVSSSSSSSSSSSRHAAMRVAAGTNVGRASRVTPAALLPVW